MSNERETHSHLYTSLGKVVRERRKELSLSQDQLAERANVDRAFLSNIERGQRKPSFGTVYNIAKGLKIKYSRLVARCEACESARNKGGSDNGATPTLPERAGDNDDEDGEAA